MDWNTDQNKMLLEAFLNLENEQEAASFLRDLMTMREIEEFSKRLQAADMLDQKISYIEIEKSTGLSSATIARVAKWLNSETGGYRSVLKKHHQKDNKKVA